jgi:hypothetical protein
MAMKKLVCTIAFLTLLSMTANAQLFSNLGFNGGYLHVSKDNGLNGFNGGAEVVVVRPVTIAADYDMTWNTSTLGVFELTTIGQTSVHTRLIDGVVGPRAYFPKFFKKRSEGPCGSWLKHLDPFIEAQFGLSNISSTIQAVNGPSFNGSQTAFTWLLGGGADVKLNPKWGFRTKIDLLRTHFANQGQSRVRFFLGVVYTVKARPNWQ